MPKSILSACLILSLMACPLPVSAGDTEAQLSCENKGGRWADGHCDAKGPDVLDIFGKIVVLTLIAGAFLGSGGSD